MNDTNNFSQVQESNTTLISLRELLDFGFERYKIQKKEKEDKFRMIANKLYMKYKGRKDLTFNGFDLVTGYLSVTLHCNDLSEDYVLTNTNNQLTIEKSNCVFCINKHDLLVFLGEDILRFIDYMKAKCQENGNAILLNTNIPDYRLSLYWNKINLFSTNEIYSLNFENIKDISNIEWELLDTIILNTNELPSYINERSKTKKKKQIGTI